jgi:Na+/H+ antiporter
MDNFQIFIMLMFAAAIVVGISQKIHIPYPISLVLVGTAIGFYPSQKAIYFDPNLILVIVLPPILYYAAFNISFREFKKNWRNILSLALGLVIFTTIVIGLIFKWIFPQFPWALAFAFGAIVSPPDAIAATTILKRFAINNRLLTILEGESLVNDASALVLYKLAVVAILSGTFSFSEGSLEFIKIVSGGILVGLVLGYLLQNFSRRYLEPVVGVVFSFTIPYITYILANYLGFSGVLAVVVNGLMGSQILIRHYSSLRRILGYATWDIFIILMNCFVFILIGLQLRTLISMMTTKQMMLYTGYAVLITFAMIAVRMVWVYAKSGIAYLKALNNPKASTLCPQILREAAIIGWSGMRGIVSLTAALALPFTLPNGMPLEGRNEVIFITFVVILLTLLLPGLTLSFLVQRLKIHHQSGLNAALRVRKELTKTAEEAIRRFHNSKIINDEEFDFLKSYLSLQHQVLTNSPQKKLQNLESVRNLITQEKRKKLFEIWERLEIDDKLLTQLEHELDLEETHIARAELK